MNPLFSFIYRTLLESKANAHWKLGRVEVYPEVEKILAQRHQTLIPGYGWLQSAEGGALRGSYKTWRQFFMAEAPRWLVRVREAEITLVGEQAAAKGLQEIERFMHKALRSRLLQFEGGVWVHGGAMQPANVVMQDGVVSLVPWQWSLSGDPAWEFCDPAWEGVYAHDRFAPYIETYRALSGEPFDKGGFMRRVKLYRPLWLLWSASVHAKAPRSLLFGVLRDMLQSELKSTR